MAKDPICGMTVDEATALSAERGGEKFYFCSEHCRQKFLGQTQPMPPLSAKPEHGGHSHHQNDEPRDHSHHGHEHATIKPSAGAKYFCPMHPEVIADKPGSCPKCGMALERNPVWKPDEKVIYTCPMHPQIEQDHPGSCPICGMALEPKTISAETVEDDSELRDMTRRFWIGVLLTLPVFIVAMAHLVPAWSHAEWLGGEVSRWGQFILTTPVVLWAGWPFFVRGWRSLVNRSLNMFTLIALGVGAAYAFSAVAMFWPQAFPAAAGHAGKPAIYFEAAAVITVLVLLGQVARTPRPPAHQRRD